MKDSSDFKRQLVRALLKAAVWMGLVVALLVIVARSSETAGEVLVGGFANLFGFVTTPFILETSVAFVGIIVVMSYNQWRAQRDGDDWVTMEVADSKGEDTN
jgi:hypothetical protein